MLLCIQNWNYELTKDSLVERHEKVAASLNLGEILEYLYIFLWYHFSWVQIIHQNIQGSCSNNFFTLPPPLNGSRLMIVILQLIELYMLSDTIIFDSENVENLRNIGEYNKLFFR